MDNAHNRQVNRVNTGINGTEADFENGALEHFGGLEQGENAPIPVMWVGITERMPESMCLLHYSLRLPYVETPRDRVMQCRPESRWTDSEKAIVREREILDYAVHRVANAILDVRLAKIQDDPQAAEAPRSGRRRSRRQPEYPRESGLGLQCGGRPGTAARAHR